MKDKHLDTLHSLLESARELTIDLECAENIEPFFSNLNYIIHVNKIRNLIHAASALACTVDVNDDKTESSSLAEDYFNSSKNIKPGMFCIDAFTMLLSCASGVLDVVCLAENNCKPDSLRSNKEFAEAMGAVSNQLIQAIVIAKAAREKPAAAKAA